jgi:hypothetical protein
VNEEKQEKQFERFPIRSRRVIQLVVQPTSARHVVLGQHNNMMITTYDGDLFIAEGASDTSGVKFLDQGETVTLLNDTNESIFLRSETVSTRVRIVLW